MAAFSGTPLEGGVTAGNDATFTVTLRPAVDGPPLRDPVLAGGWARATRETRQPRVHRYAQPKWPLFRAVIR